MSGFSVPVSSWLYQGIPAASGTLDVYETGTTTHVNIYSDAQLTSPITNPATLDANGQVKFYVSGAVNLRLDGFTSNGTFIASIDPVYPVSSLGVGTVVYQSTNFTLSSNNAGNNIIATAPITITLPLTTTLNNAYSVQLNAQGGAITLIPDPTDSIQGQAAGMSFVLSQGTSASLWTDAAGHWGFNAYFPVNQYLKVSNNLSDLGNIPTALVNIGFAATSNSLTLPTGLIMKWGTATIPANAIATVTFPVAFTSNCFNVQVTPAQDVTGGTAGTPPTAFTYTKTGFQLENPVAGIGSVLYAYHALGN